MIQYQILQTDIIRIVCQTLKRITNEIFGVKGLGKTLSALGNVLQCYLNIWVVQFPVRYNKDLTNFNREGAIEALTTEMSSKEITIESKRGLNQMHRIQFILILSFFPLRFDQIFPLIKAKEALSLSEETNPEETDETMAVALNPYTCEVVIKRLNVPGASSSY